MADPAPAGPALAGPSAQAVLRQMGGLDGAVCLVGEWSGGGVRALLSWDPLLVLRPGEDPIAALAAQPHLPAAVGEDFVGGGWFGWLAYEGASQLAYYDHVLRLKDGAWYFEALWNNERDALLQARCDEAQALLELAASQVRVGTPRRQRWQLGSFAGTGRTEHLTVVERAIELIRAGEIYQVNVCTRLAADFSGDAAALFADSSEKLNPRYGAYVEGAEKSIASFSPELFLRRRARALRTEPIKGTMPRTADEGDTGAQRLRGSAKDAAENVMIVDLMRNDFGRVCKTGSVRAAELLRVQPHPGLWHLVSAVTGELRAGVTDAELLLAAFPPGSVTGAPKPRAVRAIAELESAPRGVYTGAVGFASPCWGAEFSVAIRTFEFSPADSNAFAAPASGAAPTAASAAASGAAPGREVVELGVGGGITAESVPMREWRECLDKAAPLLAALGAQLGDQLRQPEVSPSAAQLAGGLLETILAVDGVPLRLADHLARLDRSCHELYGWAAPVALAERVRAAVAGTTGRWAARVLVSGGSPPVVQAHPVGPPPVASQARLVTGRRGLWRHKWADRGYLVKQEQQGSMGQERQELTPLFVAADANVLETSRGNVFLLAADGTLVTPPLGDDLLPGTTRRALLDLARDTGRASEIRPIAVEELKSSAAFWTSSLSLVVPIHAVDGVVLPRRDSKVMALRSALTVLETGK